jgi:hypothetical protein
MVALQESSPRTMQRDRNSFIFLQHLHTLTESNPSVVMNAYRIGADLGFSEAVTGDLLTHLSEAGCVYVGRDRSDVSISAVGVRCIEQAWRRRSVRLTRS